MFVFRPFAPQTVYFGGWLRESCSGAHSILYADCRSLERSSVSFFALLRIYNRNNKLLHFKIILSQCAGG